MSGGRGQLGTGLQRMFKLVQSGVCRIDTGVSINPEFRHCIQTVRQFQVPSEQMVQMGEGKREGAQIAGRTWRDEMAPWPVAVRAS